MSNTTTAASQLLAVDSHVHLHDRVNLGAMLNSALTSFAGAVREYKSGHPCFFGVLALTEPASRNTFARLWDQAHNEIPCRLNDSWTLIATAETLSLTALHTTGARVYLLSGQQAVTGENLEVLAIGSTQAVADGMSISETLQAIRELGGYPVLPWGVGKWLGARGRQISQILARTDATQLALGDNGGRPGFWSHVVQFEEAKRLGVPILRGSDPLPVGGMRRTAGSYGDLIRCPFDPERPAHSLLQALREGCRDRLGFGAHETVLGFIKDQIALRRR